MTEKKVVGLDIGYSNIKLVHGDQSSGKWESGIFPAIAAHENNIVKSPRGDALDVGTPVMVRGEPWRACLAASHVERRNRPTHSEYTQTDEFLASFYAALCLVGENHIDALSIGLPVDQFLAQEGAYVEGLRKLIKGPAQHVPEPDLAVTIGELLILPQPVGAWLSTYFERGAPEESLEEYLLIADPGHFSWDWVTMRGQSLRVESSGTSKLATSTVLEDAAKQLRLNTGVEQLSAERLEEALQQGREHVLIAGKRHDITQPLASAALEAGRRVCTEILAKQRTADYALDRIVLTGGGATLYAPAVKEAFPQLEVIVPEEPLLANAIGFFHAGRQALVSGGIKKAG